jgi:hypothetical protein
MEKTPNLKGFTFGRKLKNPKKCQKIAKDLRFLYIREPENPKIEGKIFSPHPFYLRERSEPNSKNAAASFIPLAP